MTHQQFEALLEELRAIRRLVDNIDTKLVYGLMMLWVTMMATCLKS